MCTAEDLDVLIWLHQTHVPFENIDAHILHKPASLGIDDLFRKIVIDRRGGICYELNAAFHALLVGLGFDVSPVFARNVRNIPEGEPAPISHRSEIVRIDEGLRYVDVGYGGPMAGCSLPVFEGSKTLSAGRWFQIERGSEEGWFQLSYASSGCSIGAADFGGASTPATSSCSIGAASTPVDEAFKPVLLFHDRPAREEDFVPYCWYTTMCPESVFVRLMFMNVRTDTGNISVRGDVYSTVEGAERRSVTIREEEIPRLAENVFGLSW